MATGEDRCQDLFDDRVLPNDHFVQFFRHQLAMFPKFFEKLVKIRFFFCQGHSPLRVGVKSMK